MTDLAALKANLDAARALHRKTLDDEAEAASRSRLFQHAADEARQHGADAATLAEKRALARSAAGDALAAKDAAHEAQAALRKAQADYDAALAESRKAETAKARADAERVGTEKRDLLCERRKALFAERRREADARKAQEAAERADQAKRAAERKAFERSVEIEKRGEKRAAVAQAHADRLEKIARTADQKADAAIAQALAGGKPAIVFTPSKPGRLATMIVASIKKKLAEMGDDAPSFRFVTVAEADAESLADATSLLTTEDCDCPRCNGLDLRKDKQVKVARFEATAV